MSTIHDIIGTSKFLTQISWIESGLDEKQYNTVREYALRDWASFMEVLTEITSAHAETFKAKESYVGCEYIGHGVSIFANSFRLGDYLYVEHVIIPALRHYSAAAEPEWISFWEEIISTDVSAENPAFLKRAAVPLLIEGIAQNPGALDTLKFFMGISQGIPKLTDIIFENVVLRIGSVPEEVQIDLLRTDIEKHSSSEERDYFHTIFAFKILFRLCASSQPEIRSEAESMVSQWLSEFSDNLLEIVRITHFDYELDTLITSPDGIRILIDILDTIIANNADELLNYREALDPTHNFVRIVSKLLLQNRDYADHLLDTLLSDFNSTEYSEKLLTIVLQELSGNPQNTPLVQALMKKYERHLNEEQMDKVAVELADKSSESKDSAEKEKAFKTCMRLLEKGLREPSALLQEYASLDQSMSKEKGSVFAISGIEGRCLFIIHRLAEQHPEQVYQIAFAYWSGAFSPYLMHMACFPLHAAIHYLVQVKDGEKFKYNYQRAHQILTECFGNKLEHLEIHPYTLIGLWNGINRIIATLRPVLTYEEVQLFLRLGADRENTHWVLPYYVKFAKEYTWKRWSAEDRAKIQKQFDDFLAKPGNEEEIAQLLTDFRNRIRQGDSKQEDVEMATQLIETRKNRHHYVLSTMAHVLIDAAEKNDEKFLDIAYLYYRKWLIPFVAEMPKDVGFVYIPRTKDVLQWFYEHDKKRGISLARSLLQFSEEWQHRIFQELNLRKLAQESMR